MLPQSYAKNRRAIAERRPYDMGTMWCLPLTRQWIRYINHYISDFVFCIVFWKDMVIGMMKSDGKGRACLELFLSFLKIGAITFGGGFAMIPFIQREAVFKRKWVSDREILDIIAVAESTPGPIAVNSATYVGYKKAGVAGAFCATLGVVLPAFIIVLIISFFLRQFYEYKPVKYAFFGIRAGVLALIVKALISMAKQCDKTVFSFIVAAAAFLLVALFDVAVPIVIICCAAAGLLYSFAMTKGKVKK